MGCVLEVIGLYTLLLKTREKVSNIVEIQDIDKFKSKADYIFQMSKLLIKSNCYVSVNPSSYISNLINLISPDYWLPLLIRAFRKLIKNSFIIFFVFPCSLSSV